MFSVRQGTGFLDLGNNTLLKKSLADILDSAYWGVKFVDEFIRVTHHAGAKAKEAARRAELGILDDEDAVDGMSSTEEEDIISPPRIGRRQIPDSAHL